MINRIKQQYRFYMNGVTAQSLREKGSPYKVVWGISQEHLRELADDVRKECPADELRTIAEQLWQSDTRESQLLATLLMPANDISLDQARGWVNSLRTQELAEWLAFNLLQHTTFAAQIAYEAVSTTTPLQQILGYNILARLFLTVPTPTERQALHARLNLLNRLEVIS